MFCVNAVASGARVKKKIPSEGTSIERIRRGFLQKGLQSSASEEASFRRDFTRALQKRLPSEGTSLERERESPVGAGLV